MINVKMFYDYIKKGIWSIPVYQYSSVKFSYLSRTTLHKKTDSPEWIYWSTEYGNPRKGIATTDDGHQGNKINIH